MIQFLHLFYVQSLTFLRGLETHKFLIMNIEDYLTLTDGKQGKRCVVTTTTQNYEGIFLCDTCPSNSLLMKFRITDDFKKTLAHVADEEGNLPAKDNVIGISIKRIQEIKFYNECNS